MKAWKLFGMVKSDVLMLNLKHLLPPQRKSDGSWYVKIMFFMKNNCKLYLNFISYFWSLSKLSENIRKYLVFWWFKGYIMRPLEWNGLNRLTFYSTHSLASFWCFYFYFWTYFILFSCVSMVDFEQVNVGWDRSSEKAVADWNLFLTMLKRASFSNT